MFNKLKFKIESMPYEKARRLAFIGIMIIFLLAGIAIFIASYAFHKAVQVEDALSIAPIIYERYYYITPETFTIFEYVDNSDSVFIFQHDGQTAPVMVKAILTK